MSNENNNFEAATLQFVIVDADANKFVEIREDHCSQEVAKVLALSNQTLISKYENFDSDIDDRVYALFTFYRRTSKRPIDK